MPIYDDSNEARETRKDAISEFYNDNWDKLVKTDSFLWMFDHLPDKMRLIVDFKIEGKTNEEIAKLLHTTEKHVYNKLRLAKKRFILANRWLFSSILKYFALF